MVSDALGRDGDGDRRRVPRHLRAAAQRRGPRYRPCAAHQPGGHRPALASAPHQRRAAPHRPALLRQRGGVRSLRPRGARRDRGAGAGVGRGGAGGAETAARHHRAPGGDRPMSDLLTRFVEAYPAQPATAYWRAVEIDALASAGLPEGRGFDLGCGDGKLTDILLSLTGPRTLVGLDPDPLETAAAKKWPFYEAVLTAPGDAVPEPDGAFDFVISNSV